MRARLYPFGAFEVSIEHADAVVLARFPDAVRSPMHGWVDWVYGGQVVATWDPYTRALRVAEEKS